MAVRFHLNASTGACNLLPPTTVSLSDIDLETYGRGQPIDEISKIEAQLEQLAEVSERCRRLYWFTRRQVAGGVALLLLMMVGLFGSNQVAAIGHLSRLGH
jgi:hypothetical protein